MKKINILVLAPIIVLLHLKSLQASNVVTPSSSVLAPHDSVYNLIALPITTVIIVRHAEKDTSWNGPDYECPLTGDGEKRAETLKYMLKNSGASVVFSTNTKRTLETANNYADSKGIAIKIYNNEEELVSLIKKNFNNKTILVVGHSNTIPKIIKLLGINFKEQYIDGFDNFYIATICSNKASSLLRLKYAIND